MRDNFNWYAGSVNEDAVRAIIKIKRGNLPAEGDKCTLCGGKWLNSSNHLGAVYHLCFLRPAEGKSDG